MDLNEVSGWLKMFSDRAQTTGLDEYIFFLELSTMKEIFQLLIFKREVLHDSVCFLRKKNRSNKI